MQSPTFADVAARIARVLREAGGDLDDDTPRFLAASFACGLLPESEWPAVADDLRNAVHRLRSMAGRQPERTAGGGSLVDPNADPRNANWIRIAAAERRGRHRLPMWGAMWLWSRHADDSAAFWNGVAAVAEQLGYERHRLRRATRSARRRTVPRR